MQQDTAPQNADAAYSDPKLKGLLDSVNDASASSRAGWVLFISAMAYFFVALAGVTHEDFLLNTPVNQPILQVEVDLQSFFLFAPLVFVFVHFGILIQHEMLASKIHAFDRALIEYEGVDKNRTHPMRRQLHAYFFTQAISGPQRSKILLIFLNSMSWITLFLLPILTLLAFHITFLAYHDANTTWWHRVYLMADIAIFVIMGTLYRFLDSGFFTGLSLNMRYNTTSFLFTNSVAASAILFSLFVVTHPDSSTDVVMRKIWPEPVPYGWSPEKKGDTPTRYAFWPTAFLFEGKVDEGNSSPKSIFARNLVVTDKDLVKDSTWNPKETTLSLRARNLSYATFDRSDLRGTDFTKSVLHGARFYRTNLNSVKFDGTELQNADMREALFAGTTSMVKANLTGADLRNAKFEKLDMRLAQLQGAKMQEISFQNVKKNQINQINLEGANLRNAGLQRANLSHSILRGADLTNASLQGTILSNAYIQGADLSNANLTGADLQNADLSGAILQNANLQAADLNNTKLYGTDFTDANLKGANFHDAKVWLTPPLNKNQIELTDFSKLNISPSKGYSGEYIILVAIRDDDVRQLVRKRLGRLLNQNDIFSWKDSIEYNAWQNIKEQVPDPTKLSTFFAKQVCTDNTPEGNIAKALVFRAEKRYSNYRVLSRDVFLTPINLENFIKKISEKTCSGSKAVTPSAMYQLIRTFEDYKNTKNRVDQRRKKKEDRAQNVNKPNEN